jgi:hypothetical protein
MDSMTDYEQRPDRASAAVPLAQDDDRAKWLEKFMRIVARTFDISAGSKIRAPDLATAFDQRGYFGFAHFVRMQGEDTNDLPGKRDDKL